MRICPGKYVFVSIPKAGTHAVFAALDKNFGPHVPVWMHQLEVPQQYQDLFCFTTRRNPYARVRSQWWTMCGMPDQAQIRKHAQTPLPYGTPFPVFVEWLVQKDRPKNAGAHRQSWRHARIRADAILRVEHLEEDFNCLPFVTDWVPVPIVNQWGNTKKAPPPCYTERLAAIVYDWARETFERFNYDRQSWREYAAEN